MRRVCYGHAFFGILLFSNLLLLCSSSLLRLSFGKRKSAHRLCMLTEIVDGDSLTGLEAFLNSKFCGRKISYSPVNSGHIVKQYFPYAARVEEEVEIVSHWSQRLQDRFNDKTASKDKINNPLVAIPGAPGSGKSTFLAHLPASAAYRNYCKGKNVVVSLVTFNSGMGKTLTDAFGLRVVYGAAIAMGLFDATIGFDQFYERFHAAESKNLSGSNAVSMLQRLFKTNGNHRIVLLVDELSKATNDKEVMTEIGAILDSFEDVDIGVSALSPEYVLTLLTGSQRLIEYVVPKPLFSAGFGKKECQLWASKLIGQSKNADEYNQKFLLNAHLLLSAHPRSLQRMAEKLQRPDAVRDSKVVSALDDEFPVLFRIVCDAFDCFDIYKGNNEMDIKNFEQYILEWPNIFKPSNPEFRSLLETNAIYIHNFEGSFQNFVPAANLLRMLQWLNQWRQTDEFSKLQLIFPSRKKASEPDFGESEAAKFPRTWNVLRLLASPFKFSIASLWERVVAATIVCRSYTEDIKLSFLFGDRLAFADDERDWRALSVGFDKANGCDGQGAEESLNCLIVSRQPGYDFRVLVPHRLQSRYVYCQVEIATPGHSMKSVLAKTVVYSLSDHLARYGKEDFSNVDIVVYLWGSELQLPSRDTLYEHLEEEIDAAFTEMNSSQSTVKLSPGLEKRIVAEFLKAEKQHLHIVGHEQLKCWLIPSFLPIPELLQNMNAFDIE